jgi:hypothetical protein
MKEMIPLALSAGVLVGTFAWLVVLPTIGLLWVLGWLP